MITKNLKRVGLLWSVYLSLFFLGSELIYRAYRYQMLKRGELSFLWVEKPIYQFDPQSGFKYLPHRNLEAHWINSNDKVERVNRLHFNLSGQSSRKEPLQAKNGIKILRIAVLGDSLSACIHNDIAWPDLLEEKLNADTHLLSQLGVHRISVLNFSKDGIGLEQFPAILKNETLAFHPDLILANFITADIYRRFIWRKTINLKHSHLPYQVVLNCTSLPAALSNPNCFFAGVVSADRATFGRGEVRKIIRREIATELEARMDWFSPYPEFLSFLLRGKLEEAMGRNPFHPKSPTYETRESSLQASANAIREIQSTGIPTLFLHLPVYWEMIYGKIPKLALELKERVPGVEWTAMLDYLPPRYDKEDVNRWTLYPVDMHLSNSGAQMYAESVHQLLLQRFSKKIRIATTDRNKN